MFRYIVFPRWVRGGWILSLYAALVVVVPSLCFAVRPDEASFSAEMNTAQRAVAAMHPDEKIRNPDYLAEKFVSDEFWYYYHYSRDFNTSMKFVKTFRIGGYYYVNARTKHIDKLLLDAARNGLEQVVVLGAGYDSRAYRFQKALPQVRFFELDHSPTSARKQAMVKKIFGNIPSNVTFVMIDFNKETIADTMGRAGYDPNKNTFFVWEGVSYFLNNDAVDRTLRFIATRSAPGSEVVFDYLPEAAIKGKSKKYQGVRRVAFRMSLAGEPLLSGLPGDEGDVERYIKDRGLEVLSNVGHEKLTQMYLIGSDGKPDGQPSRYYRIVHARVLAP